MEEASGKILMNSSNLSNLYFPYLTSALYTALIIKLYVSVYSCSQHMLISDPDERDQVSSWTGHIK